jgi:lysophospholipase L1-like esterase
MRTILIIGDSTAANKISQKKPESGWGEYLGEFMPTFKIDNHAQNGRSSKSFYDEGLFDVVRNRLKKNDILLIQFGHNDSKSEDPLRYASEEVFEVYIKTYINNARECQAIPVLLSSITRRTFTNHQLDPNACGIYPSKMKEIASKEGVYFIDMFNLSQKHINQLGEEKSKKLYLHLEPHQHPNYPEGVIDNTHFNEYGARVFAEMIASSL